MRSRGRNLLSQDTIDKVIASESTNLGVPCTEAEREYSQALVAEMAHSRQEESRAKRALESAVEENSALDELS
ncbi:MAG: hypothetical protein ACJATV_000511, partial [Granulosicoccus sp.]